MASDIQICNIALSHIGASSISSLTENSKEAIECNRLYEYSKDSALRDHKWNFATQEIELALLDDTYLGFNYAYAYPIDCLVIQKIYNDYSKSKKIEFQVRANKDSSNKVLLTDESDAKIIYTSRVTNTNLFDTLFIEALSWRLATDLAQPVRGDLNVQQVCLQAYLLVLGQAKSVDSNESYEKPVNENIFTEARN